MEHGALHEPQQRVLPPLTLGSLSLSLSGIALVREPLIRRRYKWLAWEPLSAEYWGGESLVGPHSRLLTGRTTYCSRHDCCLLSCAVFLLLWA